jgi:hypothetical protein
MEVGEKGTYARAKRITLKDEMAATRNSDDSPPKAWRNSRPARQDKDTSCQGREAGRNNGGGEAHGVEVRMAVKSVIVETGG